MRPRLVVLCVALIGVAAAVAAGATLAVAQSPQALSPQALSPQALSPHAMSPQARLQADERAARQDAHALLQALRLPPTDITATRTEPRFARAVVGGRLNGSYYAGAQLWQVASASPGAIIAYVRSHPPAGSTADLGTGSTNDAKTGVHSVDLQFSWPDVRGKLIGRMLTVTVVTPRHGYSVVVARSQSYWFVPRSLLERVPSGVHAVTISLRLGNGLPVQMHVHTTTYEVTKPSRVRALVDALDSLPTLQPGTPPMPCPLILTGSQAPGLTLEFKTRVHGATLAMAQVSAHHGQGWADGAGFCNPIQFWIGGKQQTSLTSPGFVKRVGKLIGANIS